MTAELKPCPFCGGEASEFKDRGHSTAYNVGCFSGDCTIEPNTWAGTKAEAIAAWNTRADLSQSAIAAKNAQILDLIEALRRRTDGEICGCGVDNPTDVCLSHYDVIEAVVRNRVQAAIAAAMIGAVKLADGIAGNTKDYDREHRRAAGQIGALIKASIPTDAAAALGAALLGAYKEGWSDGAANCHHDRNETPDDGWLISDTYKSIPTDATAAAIRAMKGGE